MFSVWGVNPFLTPLLLLTTQVRSRSRVAEAQARGGSRGLLWNIVPKMPWNPVWQWEPLSLPHDICPQTMGQSVLQLAPNKAEQMVPEISTGVIKNHKQGICHITVTNDIG